MKKCKYLLSNNNCFWRRKRHNNNSSLIVVNGKCKYNVDDCIYLKNKDLTEENELRCIESGVSSNIKYTCMYAFNHPTSSMPVCSVDDRICDCNYVNEKECSKLK